MSLNTLTATAKAKAHANRIAKVCESSVRLVADTGQGGDVCFIVLENPTCAIVVYLDDPDTQCSTGNHPGRFVAIVDMA